jgi:hypothetical protein
MMDRRQDTLWMLSNTLANDPDIIALHLTAEGLLSRLVFMLKYDDWSVRIFDLMLFLLKLPKTD